MRYPTKISFCRKELYSENCIPKSIILKPPKIMKKSTRGSHNATSLERVTIAHWNENSFVTLLIKRNIVESPVNAKPSKRNSRSERKKKKNSESTLIPIYHQRMTGKNLLDNFVSMYPTRIQGEKMVVAILCTFSRQQLT